MSRRFRLPFLRLLGAALAIAGLAACSSDGGGESPVAAIPPPSSLGLRVGDVVLITLSGIPENAQLQLAIDDQGALILPYIGSVQAAGKTESQISNEIRDTYTSRKIYNRVDVSVAAAQRFLIVGGQVNRPGRVLWTPDLTLSKAIQDAGGFTLYSRKSGVILNRDSRSYTVDVDRALREPARDVRVYPGDNVNVPRSPF